MKEYKKEYKKNMTDEQKQKIKDYQKNIEKIKNIKTTNIIISIIYKILKIIYRVGNYKRV